ncbi:MAG: hypothetical protein OHK0037_14700 [Elainellaceae cyanobacterium]
MEAKVTGLTEDKLHQMNLVISQVLPNPQPGILSKTHWANIRHEPGRTLGDRPGLNAPKTIAADRFSIP